MKTALIALATLVVALTLPAVATAQEWVIDWHSTGNVAGAPFTWDITATSPATLTPVPGSLPPSFTGQAFDLIFTHQGRSFGGLIAQGTFQSPEFSVPAAAPINAFSADFASGDFSLSGNTFTLHTFIGLGHNNAEFTATGLRNTTTASAPEPGILLVAAAGLVGAALTRARARR